MEVCEVGAVGYAPLRAPANSEKAKRVSAEVAVGIHSPAEAPTSQANARPKTTETAPMETGAREGGAYDLVPGSRRAKLRLYQWIALALALCAGAVAVWLLTKRADPLVEMRRKELEREVSLLLSQEPLVIRQRSKNYTVVERLDPIDVSPFQVLNDQRIIDLRRWKDVPSDKLHELFSAVCQRRRVRLKKVKAANEYETEGRTSGLELFWQCLSPYPSRGIAQSGDVFVGQDRMKARRMAVDVSSIPVGGEFELDTAATYWNSIQTEQEQWFGAIGYNGAFKVSMLMLFPEERSVKKFRLMTARTVRDQPVPYNGPEIVLTGEHRQWVYWEIPSPEEGRVYRLHWDW